MQLLEFILSTFCTVLSTHGRLTRSSGFSFLSWAWGSEPWRQHRAAASTAPCHSSCLPMNLGRTPFAPAQQGFPWLPPLHFLSAHCFQYLKRKIKHLEDASLFTHCLTFPTTICSPRSFSINVGSKYAIEFTTILKQILSKWEKIKTIWAIKNCNFLKKAMQLSKTYSRKSMKVNPCKSVLVTPCYTPVLLCYTLVTTFILLAKITKLIHIEASPPFKNTKMVAMTILIQPHYKNLDKTLLLFIRNLEKKWNF